jgi:hypothetical protein
MTRSEMRVSCNSSRRASVIGGSLEATFTAIFEEMSAGIGVQWSRAMRIYIPASFSNPELFHFGAVRMAHTSYSSCLVRNRHA